MTAAAVGAERWGSEGALEEAEEWGDETDAEELSGPGEECWTGGCISSL